MKENRGIMKAARCAGGMLAALIIGMTPLAASLPPVVKADPVTIDLELGGEGATYWGIAGIKPTDSGTKTVELHNAGTSDGFVTIWVSDIVNSEGLNPEPETGDTSEPGELGDYLLFDITAENLTSNLNLPVTIGNLPQSAADSDYIDIMPIKAGETVELEWHWELPADTGNIVQGDSIVFSINYMLQECVITDVSSVVTSTGNFTQDITVMSQNSKGKLFISANTTGTVAENKTLTDIWIIELINKEPLPPATGKENVSLNYDAGPEGMTFDRPIIITLSYDPDKIPDGISEEDLFPAVWNKTTGDWAALDSYTVYPESNTITALISHFSRYTVMSPVPEPDTPTGGSGDTDETAGIITTPEEPETTGALLETDMLGNESTVEIGEDGTLGQTLTISDAEGNFTIDIAGGTRITGPDGILLSRIEMIRTERTVTVPDGTVILSPTYELTGYTADMEAVPVTFEPPARLTISYDPKNLPENSFQPFVAAYTDEQGMVRLAQPAGSFIETGKASGLITDETLFFAAVELAPPPPPLPARFEATNLLINPVETSIGETVSISLTVTNHGEIEGSTEVHLIIDGIVRSIEELTLSPYSSETLTFEVSNLAAGSHQVKIAGLTGEFTVARMEVSVDESEFNWLLLDTIVGFSLLTGAIALYILIKRARRTQPAVEKEKIIFKDD